MKSTKEVAVEKIHYRIGLNPLTGTNRICFSVKHLGQKTTLDEKAVTCENCKKIIKQARAYLSSHADEPRVAVKKVAVEETQVEAPERIAA
jgi:hypothetical protein